MLLLMSLNGEEVAVDVKWGVNIENQSSKSMVFFCSLILCLVVYLLGQTNCLALLSITCDNVDNILKDLNTTRILLLAGDIL